MSDDKRCERGVIVNYVADDGQLFPAVIVMVVDTEKRIVSLTIFSDWPKWWEPKVEHDQTTKRPDTWHW